MTATPFTISSQMLGQIAKKQKLIFTSALLSTQMSAQLLEPLHSCKIISTLADVPSDAVLIGTHDGSFHCDEVLAISLLSTLPAYKPSPKTFILRTRNSELLEKCNIVVDVGAVYDPENHRYDHHQRTFTGVMEGFNTKLSSAGLVYKHFGRQIIENILDTTGSSYTGVERAQLVDACYTKLYKDFMEHIDAIDNGISVTESGEPRYHISTTLSSRVGQFNPSWNQPQGSVIQNEQFAKALLVTGSEFLTHAQELFDSWWPARSIVQQALDTRFSSIDATTGEPVHSADGKIIMFSQACPWKDHLFELEAKGNITPVLYALYADLGGSWRIQAVPQSPNSFESRKKLPAEWCGLRDAELSAKAGIEGCIFIHASGFIGGHATKQGAIAMAIKALSM